MSTGHINTYSYSHNNDLTKQKTCMSNHYFKPHLYIYSPIHNQLFTVIKTIYFLYSYIPLFICINMESRCPHIQKIEKTFHITRFRTCWSWVKIIKKVMNVYGFKQRDNRLCVMREKICQFVRKERKKVS